MRKLEQFGFGSSKVGLTRKQKACLEFLKCARSEGYSPSYQQIVAAIGIGIKSRSGVHRLIKALIERGHLVHRAADCPQVVYFTVDRINGEAVLSPLLRRQAA